MMSKHAMLTFAFAFAVAGCGGSQPSEGSGFIQPTAPPTAGKSSEGTKGDTSGGASEGGGLNEDQKKQMEIALRRGGEKAANCGDASGAEPGKAEVQVTFDGQKGRVTDVAVGSPWAGKPGESCIKRAFEKEIILPFDGDPMEVPYTVEILDKKAAAAAKAAAAKGAASGTPAASGAPKAGAPPKK